MSIGIDVGIRNLAICAIESDTNPWLWKLVDLKSGDVPIEKTLIQFVDEWVRELGAHPGGLQIWKRVMIERQPKRCGRLQKSIQDWIYILLTDRLPNTKVKLIHAKHKFGDSQKNMDLSTYTLRKRGAIDMVEGLIKKELWPIQKGKRDDLADAYLLAITKM
jgi:hypothetical protein